MHPTDALHGGLGVIGRQEIVVAVSNSGETEELLALMPYLRSREVNVIAIVGNLESTLAREAAVALDASAEREAGPHGLVPTASVAVALALGDALALTVMELKGVTRDAFAANHPSGRLGRGLTLRVRDVMHDDAGRRAGYAAARSRRRDHRGRPRSREHRRRRAAAYSGSSPTATSAARCRAASPPSSARCARTR